MNLFTNPAALELTRRNLFASTGLSLGGMALHSLMGSAAELAPAPRGGANTDTGIGAALPKTHFPTKCKNVIYLHMVGGPAQMDLYDYKPKMKEFFDKDLPESVRMGQRLTTMTSGQSRFPIAPSKYRFARKGQCGMWMNDELLPFTARMADDMVFIRTMNTEAINHEPAITNMQTGNMVTGRPCLGAWASYGLGSLNENLPRFVVMVAKPSNQEQVQAISARLWQSGYLPGEHSAVSFRAANDPILFINNPPGVSDDVRRATVLRPEAQGIRLDVISEGDGLVALADSQRLAQVVDNLATNAVKYGAAGGEVLFRAKRVYDGVRIEVVDKGPGLSPEKQAQLFEPFNRLGLERSAIEGHGIGLALAKRLVELQGGSIGVESVAGEGATFWIELPAA